MKYSIGIVGAGNVAWHFGHAFLKAGHKIEFVAGRNREAVISLATQVNAEAVPLSNKKTADVIFFTISDSALEGVLKKYTYGDAFLIHTSGTLPLNIFEGYSENYGVIYPFQTLTKDIPVNMKDTPLCIEGKNHATHEKVLELASSISSNIHQLSSEQRQVLHLTGVLANNFSNYLYGVAGQLLIDNGLNPHLLEPLILETATKLINSDPETAQTGPARRNNQEIISEHLKLLKNNPQIQQLYSLISEQITKKYND